MKRVLRWMEHLICGLTFGHIWSPYNRKERECLYCGKIE